MIKQIVRAPGLLFLIQTKFERMAQGKQQLKFERKTHVRYGDNCDTD